jgi:hypothetical protein
VIPPVYATAGLARALNGSNGPAPGGIARELLRSPDALVVVWERRQP